MLLILPILCSRLIAIIAVFAGILIMRTAVTQTGKDLLLKMIQVGNAMKKQIEPREY